MTASISRPAIGRLTFLAPLALLLTSACSRERFPLPMTAADFAANGSGPALVAYLGQRDASPEVCDGHARSPHLVRFDDEVRAELVDALVEGRVEPTLWRKCVKAFLRSAPKEMSASLMDDIGHRYKKVLLDSELDASPERQARLTSMQELYVDRDNGLDGHAAVLGPMFDDLRNAVAKKRLGPTATRFATELLVVVDLERGIYEGRPVDVAAIDQIYAAKNERELEVFAQRLPNVTLRDEARRRIIRLHIAASPFAEVRAAAAAVEETLMQKGFNAVSLAEHAAARAFLEQENVAKRGVLVRQNVRGQTVTLLGVKLDGGPVSVVPDVSLRGTFFAEVGGISRPITVCAPPKQLDPSPCIATSDVRSQQRVAYVDADGALRFTDRLTMKDALDLAAGGPTLPVPLQVGTAVVTLAWPLSFERPEDLILSAPSSGANGPAIGVLVDRRNPKRIIFHVRDPKSTYTAIVEAFDADHFHIASAGADGEPGSAGSQGSTGMSGAMCQSGGNGGSGGPGGNGGRGGNGGAVDVHVSCGGAPCTDALALFSRTIISRGGKGGPGGPGGRGGPGGAGGPAGPSTTTTNADGTTTTTPGCSAGSAGSPGSDGPAGVQGPPGKSGHVNVVADP